MRLRAFALATDSELRRAVNCQLAPLAEGYFEEVFAHQSSSWGASSPAGEPDRSRRAQPPPPSATSCSLRVLPDQNRTVRQWARSMGYGADSPIPNRPKPAPSNSGALEFVSAFGFLTVPPRQRSQRERVSLICHLIAVMRSMVSTIEQKDWKALGLWLKDNRQAIKLHPDFLSYGCPRPDLFFVPGALPGRCRWNRTSSACSLWMSARGRSNGSAVRSAREQRWWRNCTPFSQTRRMRYGEPVTRASSRNRQRYGEIDPFCVVRFDRSRAIVGCHSAFLIS
jgi:hypothetical protein